MQLLKKHCLKNIVHTASHRSFAKLLSFMIDIHDGIKVIGVRMSFTTH